MDMVKGGIMERIITDNASEKKTISWDKERFVVVTKYKLRDVPPVVDFFNPLEMLQVVEFVGEIK